MFQEFTWYYYSYQLFQVIFKGEGSLTLEESELNSSLQCNNYIHNCPFCKVTNGCFESSSVLKRPQSWIC